MKKLLFIPLVFLAKTALGVSQPPYEIKDAATAENMRVIYFTVDQHRHTGEDGSSLMYDVLPDSASHYNVGSTTNPWHFVIADQMVLGNYTTAQIRALTPATTGAIVYNREGLDIYVATGSKVGQWRNTRTGTAP